MLGLLIALIFLPPSILLRSAIIFLCTIHNKEPSGSLKITTLLLIAVWIERNSFRVLGSALLGPLTALYMADESEKSMKNLAEKIGVKVDERRPGQICGYMFKNGEPTYTCKYVAIVAISTERRKVIDCEIAGNVPTIRLASCATSALCNRLIADRKSVV